MVEKTGAGHGAGASLEVIDIWHFGMSALFHPDLAIDALAEQMADSLRDYRYSGADVRQATEALAQHCLATNAFSVPVFWDLLSAVDMTFDALYRHYVGKNVLNFFRQDHGYKEGHYVKQWQGREDNEHLVELLGELDSGSPSYSDDLYRALSDRYRALTQ